MYVGFRYIQDCPTIKEANWKLSRFLIVKLASPCIHFNSVIATKPSHDNLYGPRPTQYMDVVLQCGLIQYPFRKEVRVLFFPA